MGKHEHIYNFIKNALENQNPRPKKNDGLSNYKLSSMRTDFDDSRIDESGEARLGNADDRGANI